MRLWDYYDVSAGLKRLRSASASDLIRWASTLPAVISAPRPTEITAAVCQVFPGTTRSQALALQAELSSDEPFLSELDIAMQQRRGRRLVWQDWHPFLYSTVRVYRPNVMVETGVFDGLSSALILRAMERNAAGELVSIDLPARETIADATDRMWGESCRKAAAPAGLYPIVFVLAIVCTSATAKACSQQCSTSTSAWTSFCMTVSIPINTNFLSTTLLGRT